MQLRSLVLCTSMFALATAAASACASFEESPEGQPSGDDASTDGSVDGIAASDGGNDAANACVPEPIAATDAGPEDAHCGANGIEVNIGTSDEHCGFCGHVCAANNACANGACTAEDAVPFGGDYLTLGTSFEKYVYFMAVGPNCDVSHVARTAPDQKGSENVLTETVTGCMRTLFIANGFIYYVHGANGLRRTPVAAPVPTTMPIVQESEAAAAAATATALFTLDQSYGRVSQRALDGQSPKVVHEDLTNLLSSFGADSSSVWWTTESPAPEAGPRKVDLWGVPPGGASVVRRASDLPPIKTFALDDDYIYLASELGDVLRVKKNDASPPEVVTKIDAEVTYPRGVVVVGDYLYVALGAGAPISPVAIYRVKKCGGRARLVARGNMPDNGLVAAGGAIYFGNGNELRRFVPSKP